MGGNPTSRRGSTSGIGSNKLENRTNNCGGNKKPGIPSTVGKRVALVHEIQSRATPLHNAPFIISTTNVLSGGVGKHQSMFRAPADGVNRMSLNMNMKLCKSTCGCLVNVK